MINLLSAFCRDDQPIRLNNAFQLNLNLWRKFFQSWSGLSFLLSLHWAPLQDFQVSSHAAGTIRYGVIFGGCGLLVPGPHCRCCYPLPTKSCFQWSLLPHCGVTCGLPDGSSFAQITDRWSQCYSLPTSRNPHVMALLHHLSLSAAQHSFSFTATPVAGILNPVADALSRLEFQCFRQLVPQANLEATPIPAPIQSPGGIQGLAPSTRWFQHQFPEFRLQEGWQDSSGSILPASEEALFCFCSFLVDRLHHSSIEGFLSGVWSMHIWDLQTH